MLFMTIVWMTAHFGKNPTNGGSPPNESRVVNSANLIVVLPFIDIVWLINAILYDLVMVVIVNVSREYTAKYIAHRFLPPSRAASIHPVWLIDEYVRIFRSDVWFIPPTDPTTTDIIIITRIRGLVFIK
jgi:hypothetical protein